MPNTRNGSDKVNSIGSGQPTSAGNAVWLEELQKYTEESLKFEATLQALRTRNQDFLIARKKAAELDALKQQYETEQKNFDTVTKFYESKRLALEKRVQEAKKKGDTEALKKLEKDRIKQEQKIQKSIDALNKKAKQVEDNKKADQNIAQMADVHSTIGARMLDPKLLIATLKQAGKEIGPALAEAANKALGTLQQKGTQAVEESMSLLTGRYSKITARLQDSGENFKSINDTMRKQLAASPFIKYTDMLTKVEELVDKGVAYNIEQRAFLASISDKIASTFDAFDSNLLKIIRIQQEDSTKQRLGMEASLTKFLNAQYQDTSYLAGAHDSVTEALTASIVQLGTSKGAEFEYAVQKWFGSLSSLGMDDSTLTGLAGAINALSTGDVESMAGSEFMNLIVMAANKAGISYADILTKGLNAESVNSLLSSIVSYWSEIASTSNQVVKNQYSKLFGLSMSDMIAIKNVTQKDMKAIFDNQLTYAGMSRELSSQLSAIPGRMHISEMMNNVLDNFMIGTGMNIAANPFTAATWTINKMVKDWTGGINIPAITAMVMGTGTGFDINSDVNSLIQLGMVGLSTIGQMGKVIGGLSGAGGLNLATWGADQYTRHGQGLSAPVTGVSASTSSTVFIGNSNSQDVYSSTLNKAYDDAGYNEVKNSANIDEAKQDAETQKQQMKDIDSNVTQIYNLLSEVFTGSALRVVVENYGLTGGFGT